MVRVTPLHHPIVAVAHSSFPTAAHLKVFYSLYFNQNHKLISHRRCSDFKISVYFPISSRAKLTPTRSLMRNEAFSWLSSFSETQDRRGTELANDQTSSHQHRSKHQHLERRNFQEGRWYSVLEWGTNLQTNSTTRICNLIYSNYTGNITSPKIWSLFGTQFFPEEKYLRIRNT